MRAAASFAVVSPGLSAALCVCIARDGLEPLPPRLTTATTGPSRREQNGRVARSTDKKRPPIAECRLLKRPGAEDAQNCRGHRAVERITTSHVTNTTIERDDA